jgi:hypothetical protein
VKLINLNNLGNPKKKRRNLIKKPGQKFQTKNPRGYMLLTHQRVLFLVRLNTFLNSDKKFTKNIDNNCTILRKRGLQNS